jgi:hypothetical protein
MLKMFAAGFIMGMFTACSTGRGNAPSSSSCSLAVDLNTYCGGTFAGCYCLLTRLTNVTSCDVVPQLPLDIRTRGTRDLIVAVNCNGIFEVTPDAGAANGYYIDYDYGHNPPHLILTGSVCTGALTEGLADLAVFQNNCGT